MLAARGSQPYNEDMLRNVISSIQKQTPVGDRPIICPTCLHVTEHEVVEETVRLTLFGIPTIILTQRAIFRCSDCNDTHTLDWVEYEGQTAERAPVHEAHQARRQGRFGNKTQPTTRKYASGPSAPEYYPAERKLRRVLIGIFITFLFIAVAILIPIINIVTR